VELTFKEKLAYKESEIDTANIKLARISQTNIELKTKCDRLESCNAELSSEFE